MRAIAVIAALTAVAVLALGGTNASPAAKSSVELAFDRGGWIYVAQDDGTAVRRLTRGSGAAFSPDGSRLAFARFDRLYVALADGTGERELARAGRGYGVKWSPDGRKLAFTSHYRSGRFAVYVASADGTGVRPLVKPASRSEESDSPAWSPDGRLIAFASTRAGSGNPEIYVARPYGTGLRRLTHTPGDAHVLGDDGMPSWSRDGKQIVFTSNRTGSGALWVMRADGTGERKVYDGKGSDEFFPEFSPDGRRIAFSRLALGTTEVWIVDRDGRGARRVIAGGRPAWLPVRPSPAALTRAPASAVRSHVDLAADVLFTRHIRGTGTSDLYIAKTHSSLLERLTRDGTSAGGVFSPDGARIAFASGRATGAEAPELYVMDATGKNVRRLTRSPRTSRVFWQNTQPAWAQDGKSIVFVRTKITGTREETDLWRVDARGGSPVRLTRHPGREANPAFTPDGRLGFDRDGRIRILFRGSVIDTRSGADPTWSPDRTYLAFVKSDGIYLTLGQSERKIVEGGFSPAWSPDGLRLIYQAPEGGLEAMTVLGRQTQAVTTPPRAAADLYPSWRTTQNPRALAASRTG